MILSCGVSQNEGRKIRRKLSMSRGKRGRCITRKRQHEVSYEISVQDELEKCMKITSLSEVYSLLVKSP